MAKQIGSLFVKLSASADGFVEGLAKAEKSLMRTGRRFQAIGSQLSIGITAPLLGLGAAAFKVGLEFDTAMNVLKGRLDGIDPANLKVLNDLALKLGKETKFSALEAAKAMTELAAAGFSVNQIVEAMPALLDLAAAGQLDVAEAAAITQHTMHQFGLEATEVGRIADVLAKGANLSSTSVSGLAQALQYAGPNAKAAGLSLEQTVAALAEMSNVGIDASNAGTALRMGLLRMIAPTAKGAAAMKRLGVELIDVKTGALKPLSVVMDELAKKNANLVDISRLVGVEASAAFVGLKDIGGAALQEMTDKLEASNGYAKKLAATLMEGLPGATEQLRGSVETTLIKIHNAYKKTLEELMPKIQAFVDKVGDLADKFAELDPETKKIALGFVAFIAAIGPAVYIIGSWITACGLLVTVVKVVVVAIGGLSVTAVAVGAAIAALAYVIYAKWGSIVSVSQQASSAVKTAWTSSVEYLTQLWKDFLSFLKVPFQTIGDKLQALAEYFYSWNNYVGEILGNFTQAVHDAFVKYFQVAVEFIRQKIDAVIGYFNKLYDSVAEFVGGSAREVTKLADTVKEETEIKITASVLKTEKAFKSFSGGVAQNVDDIKDKLKEAEDAAEKMSSGISNAFSDSISGLFGKSGKNSKLIDQLGQLGGDFFGAIFTGQNKGNTQGGQIADWIGKQMGDKDTKDGLAEIANKVGKFFGFEMGDSAGKEAGAQLTNAAGKTGTDMGSIMGANTAEGWMAAIEPILDGLMRIGKSSKETSKGIGEALGAAIGAYYGGPIGAKVGGAIGKETGSFVARMFGFGVGNKQTKARIEIEHWLEDTLMGVNFRFMDKLGNFTKFKDLVMGDHGQFNKPGWGDSLAAQGAKVQGTFQGLGTAIQAFLGITEDVGAQIGFILGQTLGGNLDNARLMFQSLGVSVGDFEKALLEAGTSGKMSWLEVQGALDAVNEAAKPGLATIGNYNTAFKMLIQSGGRGMQAIVALKDVAIEAQEAGARSLGELKSRLLAGGQDPAYVEALFKGLAQRGISSLQQLANVSTKTGGGVIADMEAMGVKFSEIAKQIDETSQQINQVPDNVTKNIHYNFTTSFDGNTEKAADGGLFSNAQIKAPQTSVSTAPKKFANGGVVQTPTMFQHLSGMGKMAERAPEAIMPLARIGGKLGVNVSGGSGGGININIDARGASAGVEQRIRSELRSIEERAVRRAVSSISENQRRGRM